MLPLLTEIAMATAASSSILQPVAGAGDTLPSNPEAVPTPSAWNSSGSIGPFFAVISVLTVLAVLSCYLGRMWNGRPPTPLESIEDRGCFGWLKSKCRQCIPRDVEVGGVKAKARVCGEEKNDCEVKDGEAAEQNQPQV